MDWRQMPLFKGIDLNDSFVLGWKVEGNTLSIQIEASIWPESAYYLCPKEGDYTCYRKAVIDIVNFKQIAGLIPLQNVKATLDIDGSADYGNIDGWTQKQGVNFISGSFGNLEIVGGEPRFVVGEV